MNSISVPAEGTPPAHPARRLSRWLASPSAAALGYALAALAVYIGWLGRDYWPFTAEEGLGYALGIAGGSLMLLLLLYSVRKRFRLLRRLGATKYWFRGHMMLGIVGPVLILYHCNFNVGSLNSQVALYCTLLVAGSGILGRYIYAKIHNGLYGSKASLRELSAGLARSAERLSHGDSFMDDLRQDLTGLATEVMEPPATLLAGVWRPIVFSIKTRLMRLRIRWVLYKRLTARSLTSPAVAAHRERLLEVTDRFVAEHLAQVRRVAQFGFFERLFSVWHVIHVPFFLMMVFSALVHVLAVHMY